MNEHVVKTNRGTIVEDPPIAKFLFSDTRFAPVWTVIRVLLGFAWLEAGLHKVSDAGWMQTGEALLGFWSRAVSIPEQGRPPITFDWYRSFLQGMIDAGSYTWFAKLIAVGEVLIGVALIVGAFVGIAAFFAALMNWNFIMAGSASSNGLLLVGAIALILAWKIAGYYGADYYLLRRLGTPWRRAATTSEVSEQSRVSEPA